MSNAAATVRALARAGPSRAKRRVSRILLSMIGTLPSEAG
jgi:hypothetical protein